MSLDVNTREPVEDREVTISRVIDAPADVKVTRPLAGLPLLFEPGRHLVGGTEYMFDSNKSLALRLLSLFHLALPVVHILALRRLGYHRRGIVLMTVIIWLVLIPSYLVFSGDNLNMVVSPLGHDQDLVPAPVYYAALFVIYPLLVFGPAHVLLCRLIPPPSALVYRGD